MLTLILRTFFHINKVFIITKIIIKKDSKINLPYQFADKQQMKRKKSTEDVRSPLGGEGSMTSEEGEEIGRRKKARTTFTGRQIFELEKLFEVKKYLSSGERADMAKLLNVTETQVSLEPWHSCIIQPIGVDEN